MKRYFKYIALSAGVLLSSCNDFLDREPLDKVTPEAFFENEGDLAAYAINLYPNVGFSTIPPGSYGLSIFTTLPITKQPLEEVHAFCLVNGA